MNGFILFILVIGVLYFAFTYLKGSRNSDEYRNNYGMRPPDNGVFRNDKWNEDPSELPGNDESEMEADGEDMEEIGFDDDEAEGEEGPAGAVPEAPGVLVSDELAGVTPKTPAATVSEAPAAGTPEIPASFVTEHSSIPEAPDTSTVVIDSEVHMDAMMPSDNK